MGQPDHRHFGGHHRVWRGGDLVQCLEEHLPQPGQYSHGKRLGHLLAAAAFIRRNRGIIRRLGGDFDHRHPMGDLGQIAQHGHRIGAICVLPPKFGQRTGGVALEDHIEQVEHPAPVGETQHSAHLIGGRFARAVANRLIQKGRRIARRPFRSTGDQGKRIISNLRILGRGDLAQHGDHDFGFDPAQVKPLAARQDRDGNLANLGCRKDEFDVGGWLF
mmetsp:Transcript_29009/g.55684  ORF Transcript_29009/g.55684 Transcript_29009/m.55684 type:complete len:218 (-) Transcript_29009:1490-2143(-)